MRLLLLGEAVPQAELQDGAKVGNVHGRPNVHFQALAQLRELQGRALQRAEQRAVRRGHRADGSAREFIKSTSNIRVDSFPVEAGGKQQAHGGQERHQVPRSRPRAPSRPTWPGIAARCVCERVNHVRGSLAG